MGDDETGLPPPVKMKPETIRLKSENDVPSTDMGKLSRKQSGLIKVKEKSLTSRKPKLNTARGRLNTKRKKKKDRFGGLQNRPVSVTVSTFSTYTDLEDNPDRPSRSIFQGTWESSEAGDMESFMEELNLGAAFTKMARKFAGNQKQMLTIIQDGDEFEITDSNERRDLVFILSVGEKFVSLNEKGEKLSCFSSWEDEDERNELIIDSVNPETEESFSIRRKITEDGKLIETKEENGEVTMERTYQRVIDGL